MRTSDNSGTITKDNSWIAQYIRKGRGCYFLTNISIDFAGSNYSNLISQIFELSDDLDLSEVGLSTSLIQLQTFRIPSNHNHQ